MKGIRLIQDDDGTVDLEVADGGMAVGETQSQEAALVLMTQKGEWKEHPLVGVGLADAVGDEDTRYWKREITEQMARIGIKIKGVSIKDGQLTINY